MNLFKLTYVFEAHLYSLCKSIMNYFAAQTNGKQYYLNLAKQGTQKWMLFHWNTFSNLNWKWHIISKSFLIPEKECVSVCIEIQSGKSFNYWSPKILLNLSEIQKNKYLKYFFFFLTWCLYQFLTYFGSYCRTGHDCRVSWDETWSVVPSDLEAGSSFLPCYC